MASVSPLPPPLPQQLWFDVDRPIQPRPRRAATPAGPRIAAAAAGTGSQMELRMAAPAPVRAAAAASPPAPAGRDPAPSAAPPPQCFAGWLLDQSARSGVVGALARAARLDRQFPSRGTIEDVRARFSAAAADGDAFAALDDAERAYDRLMR